jgi:hypothetical protein
MSRTIREILENVNKSIQVMIGQKMDANEFHHELGRLANRYCKREGLEYRVWEIRLHDEYKTIANLELERQEDKRCKYNAQWRNLSLKFVVEDENILDLTVDEMKEYFERSKIENTISSLGSSIAEAYEKIERMKAQKAELEEKLKSMK